MEFCNLDELDKSMINSLQVHEVLGVPQKLSSIDTSVEDGFNEELVNALLLDHLTKRTAVEDGDMLSAVNEAVECRQVEHELTMPRSCVRCI